MAGLTAAVFTARAIDKAKTLLIASGVAFKQTGIKIAKSAGEGCNAAISVIRELKGLARYADQT